MEWVKQRKLPPCEAIHNGNQPCHDMDNLWDTLHGTYNSASGCEYNASVLDELPDEPVREWADFSEHELLSALKGCSNSSAPGPDHITWVHLKELLKDKHVLALFIVLANACLRVGHWLHIFKESLLVIVPKPNKPSYAVPKAFRPIVLLITFGKLIEKMIANRIQFDAVKHDIFHPNQLGGICQRSTEDAGLILTHLVCAGWVKGLQTSALAFDIMQFFPSINHEMFMAVPFGHSTVYCWNTFQSDSRSVDVGVRQGSALSPVISGLFIAPVMKLFYIKAALLNTMLLSFVDDGTILAQSKQLDDNNVGLRKAYKIIYLLFVAFMLVLEHDKTKLFHFSCRRDTYNPLLDLGFEPFVPKARPGDWLLDRYADRLHFDKCDPTQDRRPYLNELITKVRADPLTVLAATDDSVPQSNQYQAALAAIIYKGHRELKRTCYVSGRVTAPDAELNAISCAVRLAVKQANCQHIMVFTDSMGSAHRAVDPSVHSGQAFSLSVCRALQEWFKADDLHRITFIYVPSALRWDIHGEAHKYVTELKVRVGHCKTDNSIDALCSQAVHSVLDSWSSTFQDPTYQGSEFLELQRPDGQPIQPSYLNGGPWLSTFGHSITEFAHVCWCMTGHMPIGAYYRRFKINEPHGCTCRAALQSRQHILFHCHNRYSVHYPSFLGDIASFLKYNPMAFGFNRDPSGVR
ncbi:unnamed protein product [Cyclocybe aegerita]|uniref:Reverse transcriptase domain-containing protein n=1 Tax=Cyclocybe aegerita TaxID=1973307 RepID=A0A8S0XYX3_CYCAE|nr:unnamed protein product [Cyclocybe aegerita]